MIKFSVIFIAFIFIGNTVFAQNLKKVKVSYNIEIKSSLNQVWTTLSNLENLDKLMPDIVSKTESLGNGKGAIVTLTLKSNGLKVVERVTKLDNKRNIIVYEMLETPMPISGYKATIKITPLINNSFKIDFSSVFKVQEKDKEVMLATINNFQNTLLSNIKTKYNDEK
jgi:hypothetical protein